jgi:hypothetical protein
LDRRLPGVGTALKRLKTFQDQTGALCDGVVRRRLLIQAAEAAGAEQARASLADVHEERAETSARHDVVPGLRGLARRSERELRGQFQRLRTGYLGPRTRRWLEPYVRLERRLAAAPRRQ